MVITPKGYSYAKFWCVMTPKEVLFISEEREEAEEWLKNLHPDYKKEEGSIVVGDEIYLTLCCDFLIKEC